MGFKDSADFHAEGFAHAGGEYRAWQTRVEAAFSSEEYPSQHRVAFGYLMSLGTDYMRSRGNETKDTRMLRREIQRSIAVDLSK